MITNVELRNDRRREDLWTSITGLTSAELIAARRATEKAISDHMLRNFVRASNGISSRETVLDKLERIVTRALASRKNGAK